MKRRKFLAALGLGAGAAAAAAAPVVRTDEPRAVKSLEGATPRRERTRQWRLPTLRSGF